MNVHALWFSNYRFTFGLGFLINFLILLTIIHKALGSEEVELFRAGYNYYNQINILETKNGTSSSTSYNTIIDTGNPASLFVIQQQDSLIYNVSKPGKTCFELLEDNYFLIGFLGFTKNIPSSTGSYPTYCPASEGIVSFNSSTSTSTSSDGTSPAYNFSVFKSFDPQIPSLYNWSDAGATGDIGMTYCGGGISCSLSIFQTMILNTSTDLTEYKLFGNTSYNQRFLNVSVPLVFGLDLNSTETSTSTVGSSSSSTMQIGEIKSEYADTLQWSPLLVENPSYHQFMLKELSVCGVDLLSNWSSTWKVMIDTGSVCLTLPEEIYDSTLAWFNTTSSVKNNAGTAQPTISLTAEALKNLPAFSFQMASISNTTSTSSSSTSFYIPLENLILDATTNISATYGAPILNIDNTPHHLCLIRGDPISTSKTDGSLNSPFIIFGTRVLESIYFAADFTSGHIGLASKLSESEQLKLESASDTSEICAAQTTCRGDQKFNVNYNKCTRPSCSHYMFVEVDSATQKCQFQQGPFIAGMFFLILIIILESSSFFILQFTTYEYLTRTAEDNDENNEEYEDEEQKQARLRDAQKIDIITRVIGRCCTAVLDYFLKLLQ